MNGVAGLTRQNAHEEEQLASEALTALSESKRPKPAVLGQTSSLTVQRQGELQGRFSRMHTDLPQRPGFAQSAEFQGVCYNRKTGRWQASIAALGRTISLGAFGSEEEAARMYDRAVLRVRGDKAALNFPPSDYRLPDGSLALDLQVEAVLMEAFLDRSASDEPEGHGQLPPQHTNDAGDDAPGSAAAIGDLVRQCLGRINRADRADLQEAAEALGPGYLRLMALITDAGQVLAAAGSGAGSGARQPPAAEQAGGRGGGEGGDGDGVSEGTADGEPGPSEHPDPHRRSSSNQQNQHQQQLQQHLQQAGSWHGARTGGGPAPPVGSATVEFGRTSQNRQQQSQQQQHHQQQHHQQQQHQQQATPSQQSQQWQRQLPQHQQQHRLDRQRSSHFVVAMREEQQPQQQQQLQQQKPQSRAVAAAAAAAAAVAVSGDAVASEPPMHRNRERDLAERSKAPTSHLGGGGGAASASMDPDVPVAGPMSANLGMTAERRPLPFVPDSAADARTGAATQQIHQPPGTSNLSSSIMQDLCNHLASHIHQARQQQLQQQAIAEGAGRPAPLTPPPVVHAVAQLASHGFPLMLLLQAANHLTTKKLVPREDYDALEAVVAATERGSVPGGRGAAVCAAADAAASLGAPVLGGSQQHYPSEQQPRDLSADSGAGPAVGAAGGGASTLPSAGLARGGSGSAAAGASGAAPGIKRKSSDAVSAGAVGAMSGGSGGVRAELPGSSAAAAAAMHGIDDVAPASKRQHRQRTQEPSPAPSNKGLSLTAGGGAPGVSGRALGREGGMMDPTTSVAMAAASAAACTAGGVPIGIPTAPHEQARAAAGVAAAAAALAAPMVKSVPPPLVQTMIWGAGAGGSSTAPAAAPPLLQPSSNFGRGGGAAAFAAAAGDTGPARQNIGLGRRLFNAVASHLPKGAELECLLPPRYGFLGVLYSQPGSPRVGAALWDGADVRDLGEYSSERDARQSVDSAARLLVGALGQQPLGAAPSAARHAPSSGPTVSGGLLGGRPSMLTSGTTGPPLLGAVGSNPEIPAEEAGGSATGSAAAAATVAAAATAAARKLMSQVPYHGADVYKSGGGDGSGGGSGSGAGAATMASGPTATPLMRASTGKPMIFSLGRDGASGSTGSPSTGAGASGGGVCGPAVLIRPLGGPTGGLPTAPSTRSLISGTFSSLAPSSHGGGTAAAAVAAAARPANSVGAGVGGSSASKLGRAESRPPPAAAVAAAAMGAVERELDTVGSSLPTKAPVMGPYLVGSPEISTDGSLQLVCQILVQQDEPLSSDDLNNVITQSFNAAQLQNLLSLAGAEQAIAAVLAAASAAGQGAAGDGSAAATGRVGGPATVAPVPAATITTTLTGTTSALAGALPADESYRRHLHHPPPPQHPRAQPPVNAVSTPASGPLRAPYLVGRVMAATPASAVTPASAAAPAVLPGPPPTPFALPPAPSVLQNFTLDRDRDLDPDRDYDMQPGLIDAASVQGPLLRPSTSTLSPAASLPPSSQPQQLQQQQQLPARNLPLTNDSRPSESGLGAAAAATVGSGAAGMAAGSPSPLPPQHQQRPRQQQQQPGAVLATGSPPLDSEKDRGMGQPIERQGPQEALAQGPGQLKGSFWMVRQGSANWEQAVAAGPQLPSGRVLQRQPSALRGPQVTGSFAPVAPVAQPAAAGAAAAVIGTELKASGPRRTVPVPEGQKSQDLGDTPEMRPPPPRAPSAGGGAETGGDAAAAAAADNVAPMEGVEAAEAADERCRTTEGAAGGVGTGNPMDEGAADGGTCGEVANESAGKARIGDGEAVGDGPTADAVPATQLPGGADRWSVEGCGDSLALGAADDGSSVRGARATGDVRPPELKMEGTTLRGPNGPLME